MSSAVTVAAIAHLPLPIPSVAMPALCERDLATLWQNQSFPPQALVTTGGEQMRVIYRGRRIGGPGPDFRDAMIAAPWGLLQGDVELHVAAATSAATGTLRIPPTTMSCCTLCSAMMKTITLSCKTGGGSPLPLLRRGSLDGHGRSGSGWSAPLPGGSLVSALWRALGPEARARWAETLYRHLALPARYGAVRHLHQALAADVAINTRRQQAMLYLLKQYCTQGACGRCPLS